MQDSSTKKLQHSGKAKDMAAAKKQHQSKKKPSKDRSKAYQYQYDMAYMGNSSRHASLENVPVHFSGFNPYAGPSMHHYPQQGPQGQQGHHGQQWDQYQWQQRW